REPSQNLRNVGETAVGDLQRADPVGRVLHARRELRDPARILVRHGEPGRVVRRGIDLVPGGQLLDRSVLRLIVLPDVILRVESGDVGLNRNRHKASFAGSLRPCGEKAARVPGPGPAGSAVCVRRLRQDFVTRPQKARILAAGLKWWSMAGLWKAYAAGVALLCAGVLAAQQQQSFDYYILSLSWAPEFCADARQAAANPRE